jgi:regulator of sigma E protease
MSYVVGFLILLGPLVIIHELGHFLFARLFGVKAEVFSVGFGPKLWAKRFGETEFRLAAIPLGGYVKLLGEDPEQPLPPEERERSLGAKSPGKRFWIYFGGAFANFIFAIFIFATILVLGEPQVSNRISRVVEGSEAAKIGLRTGDRISAVGGVEVKKFEELITQIAEHPEKSVNLQIERGAERMALLATPKAEDGYSIYGEPKKLGRIDGILPFPRSARIGISDPKSIAAQAGLKTGMTVVSINGTAVKSWEELLAIFAELTPNHSVRLEMSSPKGETRVFDLPYPKGRSVPLLDALGIRSSELFVETVLKDSPAEKAGLLPGDRIVSVNEREILSFFGLRDSIQEFAKSQGGKVTVAWDRSGALRSATIQPTETKERDPLLNKVVTYTIGIAPGLVTGEAETIIEHVWNPLTLAYKATYRMLDFVWKNLVSIGKMITGQVSAKTLGGPILIGKIAGESLERGLIVFLNTMAILSVGLGILNILPIPVLDGGHILLLGVEAIRGRPLSLRQTEILQQVGLSLILLLMVFVFKNDLTRLPIFN